jgi:sorbitol-specific phosphotransferase system component IIBC
LQQVLLRVTRKLSINQRKFVAEVIGTFIVVVFASGSVVIDAKIQGVLGIPFIAFVLRNKMIEKMKEQEDKSLD